MLFAAIIQIGIPIQQICAIFQTPVSLTCHRNRARHGTMVWYQIFLQKRHCNRALTTSFCETGRFALQNGLFQNAISTVLERETVLIAML